MKSTLFVLLCGIGIAGCSGASTTTTSSETTTPPPAVTSTETTSVDASAVSTASTPATQPDNTAINARDRQAGSATAGMQGETTSDINTTAAIRRQVLEQKLSVNAANVKIVTIHGKVTLRGPVKSQDEKNVIGQIANDIAGRANVDNELEVQTNG